MFNEKPSVDYGQDDFNSIATVEKAVFNISLFQNKKDNRPLLVRRSWKQLCDKFQKPQIRVSKDGLLFSPALFKPALRRKENVKELSLLVLDIDHNAEIETIKTRLTALNSAYAIYSSHSHLRQTDSNPSAEPRFRVVIPLLVPIAGANYPALWQFVKQKLGLRLDEAAKDASRIFYTPAIANKDAPFYFYVSDGSFLDWRELPLETVGSNGQASIAKKGQMQENNSGNSYSSHEARHDELCRRIGAQARDTGRGGYEMKCPAHNGKGDSSLFYDPSSGAVVCLNKEKPCGYFDILRAFGLPDQHLPSKERAGKSTQSENQAVSFEPMPEPSDKCFYGLAGDFVKLVEPHTESDKMALLVQFLTLFGIIAGRYAYFLPENDKHFTNLFCVIVGNTATGRKGTSLGRVKQAFHDLDIYFQENCIVSGLASGEGLLYQVRDPITTEKKDKETGNYETVIADKGVTDKRLLVVEGEFAQVLRVQGREGNTLSAFLRNFWDNGTARNLTKNSPLKTTNAHVGIIGHITKTELIDCLEEVEAANGYANRFLFVCGNRSKLLPFGGDVPENEMHRLRERLRQCLEFARGVERMQFTPDAARLWIVEYERLETSRFGYLGKITQRASPYVLRLACIFALLDKEKFITVQHLEAALSVWQYCEDSARYIFGNNTGDKLANKILVLLREAKTNGLTKTEIHDLTGRSYEADRINAALKTLFENRLARFENIKPADGKKTVEKWFAIELFSANAEFAELSEFNQSEQETNSDNSANSDSEEIFTPSNGELFDLSIKEPQKNQQLTNLPIEERCWVHTCRALLHDANICTNCGTNQDEIPF